MDQFVEDLMHNADYIDENEENFIYNNQTKCNLHNNFITFTRLPFSNHQTCTSQTFRSPHQIRTVIR